jgi:transposase
MVDTPPGGYNRRRERSSIMGKKVYSDEFKRSAVEMVVGRGHTITSVAKRLGVNYHTLREWVLAAKSAAPGPLIPPGLSLEQRVRELEKENARLRMERDILKKATAYFAKEHL